MRDKSRKVCAHAISIYRTFKARKCDEITHIDFDRHENEKMESALRKQSKQYRFYIFKCQIKLNKLQNLTNIPNIRTWRDRRAKNICRYLFFVIFQEGGGF